MTTVTFKGNPRVRCVGLLLLAALAHGQETARMPMQPGAGTPVNPITDLMLIYDGGEGRLPWTGDRFKPYVYREVDGKIEWLYDGFLFLDRLAKSGRRLSPITNRKDATKSDWQDLMGHYFQDGQSMSALNQLLDSLAAQGHKPIRKRMVVIALPTPLTGSDPTQVVVSSEWGELQGKRLDFNQAPDRLKAAQWYVDEVIKRWDQKHYRHLELAGFYWLFERAWKLHHTKEIGQYINAKGSRLYWIPSWPQGRSNWQDYGFDFVYQQPNYFFHRKPTPISRLEEACQFAGSWGTSMEMEFNQDLLTKPAFLNFFDQYLQAYAKHGVWAARPVAYYEGGGAWFDMAHSHDPAVSSRFKALGDIVVKRQEKADTGFIFRQDPARR